MRLNLTLHQQVQLCCLKAGFLPQLAFSSLQDGLIRIFVISHQSGRQFDDVFADGFAKLLHQHNFPLVGDRYQDDNTAGVAPAGEFPSVPLQQAQVSPA